MSASTLRFRREKHFSVTRSFRLSPYEDVLLRAKLAGRPLSEVIRALLADADVPEPTKPVRHILQLDPSVARDLAGIANNLNQVARAANKAALNGERVLVLASLLELRRDLERWHANVLVGVIASIPASLPPPGHADSNGP